jgi:DNA-binding NarL/FixJ family response regulator
MADIRIVTIDDHVLFRAGLCALLNAEAGFRVVGESGRGHDAGRLVTELEPDVLLLDLMLPDVSGIEVLRGLDLPRLTVRVVLLTAAADSRQVVEALQLGARGLVLKDAATALLLKAIRCVMQGEYWFGHEHVPNLVEALRRLSAAQPQAPAETLTTRELRVIAAVVAGGTNRDIARELDMSEQTVKNHLSHIFDKLGVSNRLELALYAIEHKLRRRDTRTPE